MPDPTKDEFIAAAQRVAQSAPPGLSRKEFYDRVEGELNRAKSLNEPTDYNAGFMKSVKDTGTNVLHGATATLPVIGGVLGGMAGTGASPVIGTAAGAGGGAALGEGLRELINAAVSGNVNDMKNMPQRMGMTGAVSGLTTGAMSAMPIAQEALSPSAILSDVERRGTISPGVLGADAVKRAAASARGMSGSSPILTRPAWQAAEQAPAELPQGFDRYMPNQSTGVPASAQPIPSGPTTSPIVTPAPRPRLALAPAPTAMPSTASQTMMRSIPQDELEEYQRLIQSGMSDSEAMKMVQVAKLLKQSLGTPSTTDVMSRVAEHNATGRWPE